MTDKERGLLAMFSQAEPPVANAKKKPKKNLLPAAYPDYSKSLVSQGRGDPATSGALRGTGTGILGAILGALGARTLEADPTQTAIAALLAGLVTGTAGYHSGKKEQESQNTRLLALRRLGIETPGEQEFSSDFPLLSTKVTNQGTKI